MLLAGVLATVLNLMVRVGIDAAFVEDDWVLIVPVEKDDAGGIPDLKELALDVPPDFNQDEVVLVRTLALTALVLNVPIGDHHR